MIDAARALAANLAIAEDSASDLADHVVREVERLEALRTALAAFIEQPGQVAGEHAPAGSPAPASPPAARQGPTQPSSPPAPSRRGRSGTDGRRATSPESAGSTPAPRSTTGGAAARDAKLIAAGPYACDGCGREFSRPQGVGRHRPHCTGRSSPGSDPLARVEAAKTEAVRPAVSRWLCGRCPGTFSTEELRQAHYNATGHGSPEPLPTPVATERRHPGVELGQ